jgi:hypothetical protein
LLSQTLKKPKPWRSLEAQFQPVNDPSDPAVIEMVGEALQAYSYAPCKRAQVKQPRGGTGCHPGSQGQQGAGPKWYSEQGSEAPSAACCLPPRRDIQRGSSSAVLPISMEACPNCLHTENWEGPIATLFLSSHVFWTPLASCLRRSYLIGSYVK